MVHLVGPHGTFSRATVVHLVGPQGIFSRATVVHLKRLNGYNPIFD